MTKEQLTKLLHEGMRETRIIGACFVGDERNGVALVDGDVDFNALAEWLLPRLSVQPGALHGNE